MLCARLTDVVCAFLDFVRFPFRRRFRIHRLSSGQIHQKARVLRSLGRLTAFVVVVVEVVTIVVAAAAAVVEVVEVVAVVAA